MPIDPELEALIEAKIAAAVSGTRSQLLVASDRLDTVEEQLNRLLGDPSIARSLGGPTWLSGVSIMDGTVSASKLSVNELEAITTNTGDLNATGTIKAAASYPATGARVEMSPAGLIGYSGGVTTTFKLNNDGSGEIGSGANKITWTSGGVVSIPAAVIQNLTIAQVTSGVIGGQYTTSNVFPRIEIDVNGIRAKTSSATTFDLAAATGNVTIIGTFSIKSATSGQRVEITNSAIAGYDSNSVQTFVLNATGSGRLGPSSSSNNITWDGNGVSIGGVSLSNGKITNQHISVSQLSSISANLGSINTGSIETITISGSAISGGTITGTTISGGTITGTNVSVTGQLTLGSGGKIVDGNGNKWTDQGIRLIDGGSGSSATLLFQTSGSINTGGFATDSSALYLSAYGGRSIHAYMSPNASESIGFWVVDSGGSKQAGFCSYGHLHIGANGLASYSWGSNWYQTTPGYRLTVYNMAGQYVGSIPVF
jgi:hypothetical protein